MIDPIVLSEERSLRPTTPTVPRMDYGGWSPSGQRSGRLRGRANLDGRASIWHTGPRKCDPSSGDEDDRPMTLTSDEVAKVALLARLRLSPEELQRFTGQL